MFRVWIAVAFICSALISLSGCETSGITAHGEQVTNPALIVETTQGAVAGKISNSSRWFLGIPYAQAPVDNLRWQPPQASLPWSGVRAATEFGPACPQTTAYFDALNISDLSEDCLSINISAPLEGERLPVMVSIHGGGFMAGASSLMFMAAPALNEEGVILVTFNYRLGALGYFAHPLLDMSAGANFGLMDMIAALKWLQRNIAAFGGDPTRMTIEGLSAGGQSVHMLMTNPASAGLFAGAIAESGYGAWPRQPRTKNVAALPGAPSAENIALDIAGRATGKPASVVSREDLYAISPQSLVAAVSGFHIPVVDGISLPEEPAVMFARGEQHAVPLLAGSPVYDGNIYPVSGVSDEQLLSIVGDQAGKMKALWSSDFEISEEQGLTRFFGDLRYLYSAWNLTRNMRACTAGRLSIPVRFHAPRYRDG